MTEASQLSKTARVYPSICRISLAGLLCLKRSCRCKRSCLTNCCPPAIGASTNRNLFAMALLHRQVAVSQWESLRLQKETATFPHCTKCVSKKKLIQDSVLSMHDQSVFQQSIQAEVFSEMHKWCFCWASACHLYFLQPKSNCRTGCNLLVSASAISSRYQPHDLCAHQQWRLPWDSHTKTTRPVSFASCQSAWQQKHKARPAVLQSPMICEWNKLGKASDSSPIWQLVISSERTTRKQHFNFSVRQPVRWQPHKPCFALCICPVIVLAGKLKLAGRLSKRPPAAMHRITRHGTGQCRASWTCLASTKALRGLEKARLLRTTTMITF